MKWGHATSLKVLVKESAWPTHLKKQTKFVLKKKNLGIKWFYYHTMERVVWISYPVLAFSLSNDRKKNMYVDINALSRKSEKNINACALATKSKKLIENNVGACLKPEFPLHLLSFRAKQDWSKHFLIKCFARVVSGDNVPVNWQSGTCYLFSGKRACGLHKINKKWATFDEDDSLSAMLDWKLRPNKSLVFFSVCMYSEGTKWKKNQ